MKSTLQGLGFIAAIIVMSIGSMIATAYSQTTPQEQASALAVPDQRPQPKTVVAVVLCNTVAGLLVVDDSGEVHPSRFTSKEDVKRLQATVPADHNFALNLGCPGNASKDTTVL